MLGLALKYSNILPFPAVLLSVHIICTVKYLITLFSDFQRPPFNILWTSLVLYQYLTVLPLFSLSLHISHAYTACKHTVYI